MFKNWLNSYLFNFFNAILAILLTCAGRQKRSFRQFFLSTEIIKIIKYSYHIITATDKNVLRQTPRRCLCCSVKQPLYSPTKYKTRSITTFELSTFYLKYSQFILISSPGYLSSFYHSLRHDGKPLVRLSSRGKLPTVPKLTQEQTKRKSTLGNLFSEDPLTSKMCLVVSKKKRNIRT